MIPKNLEVTRFYDHIQDLATTLLTMALFFSQSDPSVKPKMSYIELDIESLNRFYWSARPKL